jgi:hypothetical protein
MPRAGLEFVLARRTLIGSGLPKAAEAAQSWSLDRSREIGVTQQVLVAHPADGRLRGLRQIKDERNCVQRAQQTQRAFLGWKPLELLLQPSLRWKGYHHEEDANGPCCGRDFGRIRCLAGLRWSAHLSRTRRLSVLVGLCRCPGWRADPPLLLAYPALLGRSCLARAPRAHLRLNEQPEALAALIAKFERGLARMQPAPD